MKNTELYNVLGKIADGSLSVEEGALYFKKAPFEDLDFAVIDTHRRIRQGVPEVIYGEGKSAEQIVGIIGGMLKNGQDRILITRLSEDKCSEISVHFKFDYFKEAYLGMIGGFPEPDGTGKILVAAAGTSDLRTAQEAAYTARFLGNETVRLYDVGVAGLHRLLSHLDEIMSASVIIAVAGMEGALASVVAGLADCPVIAVPTSVGYGASLGGISALLSMLNSCASGVSVVNIDNGFGAAYQASLINHLGGVK